MSIILVFSVLGLALLFFIFEWLPVDITAIATAVVLMLLGLVSPTDIAHTTINRLAVWSRNYATRTLATVLWDSSCYSSFVWSTFVQKQQRSEFETVVDV